ncbi:hypothetical protein CEXT_224341 [Caerostris extrusa]|uniref:Uncharacterized protein n=1 Tax=Caerostris extrusa TaxID=172846 RepID=A0AAV4XDS7_CAEEX|nr:hypothetical protein CEXT_224341 [Caerostris extrusa]
MELYEPQVSVIHGSLVNEPNIKTYMIMGIINQYVGNAPPLVLRRKMDDENHSSDSPYTGLGTKMCEYPKDVTPVGIRSKLR